MSSKLPKSRKIGERFYVYCVVKDCATNKLELDDISKSGISFHYFPSNTTIRDQWVAWLDCPSFIPNKGSRICSRHFTANSFEQNASLTESMGLVKPARIRLKFGAGPSIKPPRLVTCSDELRSSHAVSVPSLASSSSMNSASTQSDVCDTSESIVSEIPTHPVNDVDVKAASTTQKGSKRNLEMVENEDFLMSIPPPFQILNRRCQPSQARPKNIPGLLFDKRVQTYERWQKHDTQTQTFTRKNEAMTQTIDSGTDQTTRDTRKSYSKSKSMTIQSNDILETRQFKPESKDPVNEKKFVVFESALLQLFAFCQICLAKCTNSIETKGSMAIITSVCKNKHKYIWYSQPSKNHTPVGNLLIAASILFSGLNPTQALRMLKSFGLQVIDSSTYFRIQKGYLLKAITTVWESEQLSILNSLKGKDLSIGGVFRKDSSGLDAKYGCYTFIETSVKKVIHKAIVKSNVLTSSVALELEGLAQGLKFLIGRGIKIKNIITDKRIQVSAFLQKTYPTICHYLDVWHLMKSVKKKIYAVTKKPSDLLRQWSHSVQNHLYWLTRSSNGDGHLMKAKWLSLLRHVSNEHHGHGEPFDSCEHDDIKGINWLDPQSEEYANLNKIVYSLKDDVSQLFPLDEASAAELFHAVLIHFAPKNSHFANDVMSARLTLAALHFNENSDKIQASTTNSGKGELRRRTIFGPLMEASRYEYVGKLLNCVIELASNSQRDYSRKSEKLLIQVYKMK